MEELDKQIGIKLKKLREEKGYSVREVGERVDIHYTYVGKIEKGQIPSLDKLKKLCDLYGVSVPSLFGEEIEVPKELKDIGVEWITFVEGMKDRKLSPDDIIKYIDVINSFRNLK